jgi:diacylglycerol kinase family enzyme
VSEAAVPIVLNARARRARSALARLGAHLEVIETASAAEGRQATLAAARRGAPVVFAAGGDGTVRTVAAALLEAGGEVALGIVPLGRGNDLARALDIRPGVGDLPAALGAGGERDLDLGRVEIDGRAAIFANAVGIGLEGRVAARAGRRGYTLAALGAVLWGRRAWHLSGEIDGAPVAGRYAVLSVCNGGRTGGGYRPAPDARSDDAMLDFCLGGEAGRIGLLGLMRAARSGRHGGRADVLLGRLRHMRIEAEPPVPVHADGDVLSSGARRLEVEVIPAALRVRLPR